MLNNFDFFVGPRFCFDVSKFIMQSGHVYVADLQIFQQLHMDICEKVL